MTVSLGSMRRRFLPVEDGSLLASPCVRQTSGDRGFRDDSGAVFIEELPEGSDEAVRIGLGDRQRQRHEAAPRDVVPRGSFRDARLRAPVLPVIASAGRLIGCRRKCTFIMRAEAGELHRATPHGPAGRQRRRVAHRRGRTAGSAASA